MRNKNEKYDLRKRAKSFAYAFNGIRLFFRSEPNAWIHLICGIAVIIAGILFHLSSIEWIAILFCIALVFCSEMINTSIEKLADLYSTETNEHIATIKDIAAGSVLVSVIISICAGLIIFIPKIF